MKQNLKKIYFIDLFGENGELYKVEVGRRWNTEFKTYIEKARSRLIMCKGCGPVPDKLQLTLDDPMPHGCFEGVPVDTIYTYIVNHMEVDIDKPKAKIITQELWDKYFGDIKFDSEKPYEYEREDCLKIQIFLFEKYNVISITEEVYHIWSYLSGDVAASWLDISGDNMNYLNNKIVKEICGN